MKKSNKIIYSTIALLAIIGLSTLLLFGTTMTNNTDSNDRAINQSLNIVQKTNEIHQDLFYRYYCNIRKKQNEKLA